MHGGALVIACFLKARNWPRWSFCSFLILAFFLMRIYTDTHQLIPLHPSTFSHYIHLEKLRINVFVYITMCLILENHFRKVGYFFEFEKVDDDQSNNKSAINSVPLNYRQSLIFSADPAYMPLSLLFLQLRKLRFRES